VCGKLFDGLSDTMRGPSEILIEDDTISEVSNLDHQAFFSSYRAAPPEVNV